MALADPSKGALTLSLGKKRAWFIGYTKDGETDNG